MQGEKSGRKEQKILAERLQMLCEERKMSYYVLAARSTVPITTIMNIAHGNTKNPGVFTMMRLCRGLNVTMSEFFEEKALTDIEKQFDRMV